VSTWHPAYREGVLANDYRFAAENLLHHFVDAMTAHLDTVLRMPAYADADTQAQGAELRRALVALHDAPAPEQAPDVPDLYFALQRRLEERLGDAVGLIRVGLSRNDLDMTVYKMNGRAYHLEVGRRLLRAGAVSDGAHAFLLRDDELLDWLLGETETQHLADMVAERRDLVRQWWRYAPPLTLGGEEEGEPPQPDGGLDGARVLRGRAISPGVAQGRVCIVRMLSDGARVRPGDVLCSQTPLYDLSPWFGMASAVVTERGGLLDHAAVLVREYGIPAVFGVQGLLKNVADGDTLWVDGGRGLVQPSRHEPGWDIL